MVCLVYLWYLTRITWCGWEWKKRKKKKKKNNKMKIRGYNKYICDDDGCDAGAAHAASCYYSMDSIRFDLIDTARIYIIYKQHF